MKRNNVITGSRVAVAAMVAAAVGVAPVASRLALAGGAIETPAIGDDEGGNTGGTTGGNTGGNTGGTTGGNTGGNTGGTTGGNTGGTTGGNTGGTTGGSSGGSSGGSAGESTGGTASGRDGGTRVVDYGDTAGGYTGSSASTDGASGSEGSTSGTDAKKDQGKQATDSPWRRLGGADRYETMSQISRAGWESSEWAVLATGASFPDALVASSLAGVRGCPVLLTDGLTLSPQARAEIERLGVREAYVVGGEGAIAAAVVDQVAALGVNVHRVSGVDRAATSVAAYAEARAAGSRSDCVIVATGDAFADALSIGPWSYAAQAPILLARGGALPEEVVNAIKSDPLVRRVVIVGGEAAVSGLVVDQLGGSYEYERLAGEGRYGTCSVVASWSADHGLTGPSACVATGANFPDALAGAALAGRTRSVLLLEDGTGSAARWLASRPGSPKAGFVLGGAAAVQENVVDGLPR